MMLLKCKYILIVNDSNIVKYKNKGMEMWISLCFPIWFVHLEEKMSTFWWTTFSSFKKKCTQTYIYYTLHKFNLGWLCYTHVIIIYRQTILQLPSSPNNRSCRALYITAWSSFYLLLMTTSISYYGYNTQCNTTSLYNWYWTSCGNVWVHF